MESEKIKGIEIVFPVEVEFPYGFDSALASLIAMMGANYTKIPTTKSITIRFQKDVEIPPGLDRAIDGLLGMVCALYEKHFVDRVMWVAGVGAKMIPNEPHEPDFDTSILQFSIAEREDFHGRNRNHPDYEERRAAAVGRAKFNNRRKK